MIMIKCDKVLSPAALISLNNTIALILDFVGGNDVVPWSYELIHMLLWFLRAEWVVVDSFLINTDLIEIPHVEWVEFWNIGHT